MRSPPSGEPESRFPAPEAGIDELRRDRPLARVRVASSLDEWVVRRLVGLTRAQIPTRIRRPLAGARRAECACRPHGAPCAGHNQPEG